MIYVVSDLHGCLDEWLALVKRIDLKSSDELYVLGDVIDVGPKPMPLMFDLMERANVFAVLGEHEYTFLKCFKDIPLDAIPENFTNYLAQDDVPAFKNWIKNGGAVTFEQYMGLSYDDKEAILDYLDEFAPYDCIEVEGKEFVLTHSGIMEFDPKKDLGSYPICDFLFNSHEIGAKYFDNKYVISGHVPTFKIDSGSTGKIIFEGKVIHIDCGCAYPGDGGHLACLRLNDMKEFYV